MQQPVIYALIATVIVFATAISNAQAEPVLAGYGATGDLHDCVDESQVQHTIILDDSTVVFRLQDDSHFMNRLPALCEGLKGATGISYSTARAEGLCAEDIIFAYTFCALGPFERLERR